MTVQSILVVTELFTVGGLETHVRGEIQALTRLGCRVHLAVGEQYSTSLVPPEVASVAHGLHLSPRATADELGRSVQCLRDLIRRHRIEVVHAHPFAALIASAMAAELERVPLVISLHGPVALTSDVSPLHALLLKAILLPSASRVVGVSPEIAELVSPFVVPDRCVVLPNAVSFAPAGSSTDDATGKWLVVSRLDAAKQAGILDFIRKAQSAGLGPLQLVGDGDARQAMQEQLVGEGLAESVEFLGARADVAALMAGAAGVAGMGRVVLEGVASGRPVILIGYDGVKGVVGTRLLQAASESNFSGRGLPTVDGPTLAEQCQRFDAQEAQAICAMAREAHDEDLVWAVFLKGLEGLRPAEPGLLGAWLAMLAVSAEADQPYLQSALALQHVGDLVHGFRYFEPRLAAADARARDASVVAHLAEQAAMRQAFDTQLTELRQSVTERDQQISERIMAEQRLRRELLSLSDWAASIQEHPLRYAIRKTARDTARTALHAMPLSSSAKQRLRAMFYSLIRPLRSSARRGPVAVRRISERVRSPVHPRSEGAQRDVFVFAVIDWHFRMQRPQQIARSLAQADRRVLYFSNHFVDASEPGYELEEVPGGDGPLYQIKLHLKGAPAIYYGAPTEGDLAMLQKSMAEVIRDFGALSSVSIVQHAYWYPLVQRLPNSYRVYDCMDHHEGFGDVADDLVRLEKEMLVDVDLVTVTSSWLADFAHRKNSNVAIIRNAVEYAYFSVSPQKIYKDPLNRKIIGYYGAIAAWFDLDLIRSLAQTYPDCLVLLVGNDTVDARKHLSGLNNIQFTGEVPYSSLTSYLYAFDVCLLPFRRNDLTLATNPVKVYEYLAAGKPVVAVDLPEVAQFGDLVERAASAEDFVTQVGRLLDEIDVPQGKIDDRRQFAAEQTWSHRSAELLGALKNIQMPRVSVIVLTFNNLALTQACLSSILQRSDYPDLEIIVVDNASSDQTPDYLNDLAQKYSNIRLILNQENLGFAAGNNVGLAVATGDYIVILNNDTVVTEGWVLTLLRHFQKIPDLGLLGPVTKNIGNEARIDVHYDDVEQMPLAALDYTLGHMGDVYYMRSAAFFCVMMKRKIYEKIGPLDESFGIGFFEDDDYCRRVEALGLKIACAEDIFVHHHLSASFDKIKRHDRDELFKKNKMIYEKKWGQWVPHHYRDH